MFVSILQLMGFPMAKPVHSRAGETPYNKPSKASTEPADDTHNKQASSNRRDQVNAKSGKDPKSKAAAAPVKAAAKAAAKPVKAAPKVVKAATKPAAKASPVAKTAAKPAEKSAKPVAKAAPKGAPKAAAKTPAKAAAKAASPKPSKAPAPAVAPKPAVASKPAAKPAPPEKVSPPMTTAATKPVPAPAAAPAVVAQKTGRPSSRLAQLTVPSMAQTVASTAAKASYSQSIPSPVIVPALPSSIKKDPKLANNWNTKPVAELTDAELMAMPDSEYMNDVQMAAFRLKLSTLKQEILNSAGETTEHLREDTSVVPDPADRATIEEEHALELRTRDRERKLLKKIEQSIGRIDAGDYGYCDETGEPIGVGRLLARPTATLSLEAQQRRELKQKMFGD
ncbi:MAG: RNA polymerase-binding protein DksA [Rhodoferax sp.]|nr:RNA polymerase-binding protein DksA [Rhodoferax sp.]